MITHLVDSDWVVDYLDGQIQARELLTPLIREGSLAISVIVYAEITEGLLSFDLSAPQVIAFSDFVSGVAVLGLSRITGDRFAQLRFDLRRSGQLIPDHDLWIAATAVELDATLVSRDTHFDRLEILKRHR